MVELPEDKRTNIGVWPHGVHLFDMTKTVTYRIKVSDPFNDIWIPPLFKSTFELIG